MATERMASGDAAWLHMDRPTNLMVVNSVLWFDEPLDWIEVERIVSDRVVRVFPRFRQRVADPRLTFGAVSGPRWQDFDDFRLEAHVHRARLEAGDPVEALQAYVSRRASVPLDSTRPLWEIHYLDGYGEGSAIVLRTHHALADGIALVQVLFHLADGGPTGSAGGQMVLEAESDASSVSVVGRLRAARRRLPRPSGVRDLVTSAQGNAGMLRKFTVDLTDEDNALRRPLGVDKQLTWSDPLPLEDLKRVGKATSSTVNDVALTLIAGALNRYLTTQKRPVSDVRAVVPFNLRPLDEPLPRRLGNLFGMVFVDLPVTVVDARERLTVVQRQMNAIKASQEGLVVYGAFTAVGGRTPKQVAQAWMDLFARKATAVITNIAGPRNELTIADVPLSGFMLWVPASGSIGIGLSIVSYNGSVTLGVAVDPNIVPDSEGLLDALRDEMADLAQLS